MRTFTLLTSARFALQGEPFVTVPLPHTWNAVDGQDGGADYHRGIGTYIIDLPNPTKGKNNTLRFRALTMLLLSGATDASWAPTRAAFLPSVMT